ncbi:gamma-glutamyl-gamma-aminobutyrate hydrolase family protein [Phormidium sp. CLA17]|uniref:gamma-glutamyl-gamma-aminobutyrate hydrolase family protein n=1 Tax=Leptolyngbya sp. Cla-17 TaxID=2803751 RepID=UPI001490C85A|nr:gamma-glutamyl-gamma-aminobutyrate hydrolase family protein [Leptolyngbya sp. Cla-17]MBM0741528.1 gamma-glutamyl-gamma-aminobutyrate hydrolase family protein [Leptolyngbya sp. Cla-17]
MSPQNSEIAPIIGITTYSRNEAGEVSLPGAYLDAVQLAGGIPILLPPHQAPVHRILEKIDGLILTGGDIDPTLYGGVHHPTIYLVDVERDAFEFALAQAALTSQVPTLGICRGMQMLSVASGAALIPHVPEV